MIDSVETNCNTANEIRKRTEIIDYHTSSQTKGIEPKDIITILTSPLDPNKTNIIIPAGYTVSMVLDKIEVESEPNKDTTANHIFKSGTGNITGNLETKTTYDNIYNKRDEEEVQVTKSISNTFISESLFLALSLFLVIFGVFNIYAFSALGNCIVSPYISFTLILVGIGWGSSVGLGLFKIWRKTKR